MGSFPAQNYFNRVVYLSFVMSFVFIAYRSGLNSRSFHGSTLLRIIYYDVLKFPCDIRIFVASDFKYRLSNGKSSASSLEDYAC